jgi:hypothetical protein
MSCNDMVIAQMRAESEKVARQLSRARMEDDRDQMKRLSGLIDDIEAQITQIVKDDEEFHRLADGLNARRLDDGLNLA